MKIVASLGVLAVLLIYSFPSFANEMKLINEPGKYTGMLVSVSKCKLDDGDKRYCKYLDIKLKSGEVIRSEFYMYVRLIKNNHIIYNGPDTNKSSVEQHNYVEETVKNNLLPESKVNITVTCGGDSGCYTPVIEISESEATDKISNFDIHGIKLGMHIDDVKVVFPQISFHGRDNYKNNNDPERFSGGAGTGWGMITDWNVFVTVTDEPYGLGAYYIHYKKFFNERIDASTFLKNFKNDLIIKYGNPSFENVNDNNSYFACWGNKCNKNLINLSLHDKSGQYQAVRDNKIQKGKYLIVTFDSVGLQEIKFTLFDTTPYSAQIEELKKREIDRAKEKVKF